MIGIYDYTVLLTYLSVASASIGILVSLSGEGHPMMGIIFLMFCGICDAFDGKVAHMKKDRSPFSKKFGIQVDSLADAIAFGVLPVCIGVAMIRRHRFFEESIHIKQLTGISEWIVLVFYAIMVCYVLAGVIRLANFNVKEEERQISEKGNRTFYEGLPITSAAIIFPVLMPFQFFLKLDFTIPYFVVMFLTGFAFVTKIKIPKIGTKTILILICIGLVEYGALVKCCFFP